MRPSRFTPEQIAEMNAMRWERGRSVTTIARIFGCHYTTVCWWTTPGKRDGKNTAKRFRRLEAKHGYPPLFIGPNSSPGTKP